MLIYEYADGREDERKEDIWVIIKNLLMVIMVSIAVFFDIKTWKIPNWLIMIGILTGSFINILSKGLIAGMKYSVTGIVIPVVILFVLFLLRLIGAGDIKLFSAVGAFVGASISNILLYAFISGGIISALYVVNKYFCKYKSDGRTSVTSKESKYKNRIHFSIAILCGVMFYILK